MGAFHISTPAEANTIPTGISLRNWSLYAVAHQRKHNIDNFLHLIELGV